MSDQNGEFAVIIRQAIERHVDANPQVVVDFNGVFGPGTADTARQWLVYQLSRFSTELATVGGPVPATAAAEPAPTAAATAQSATAPGNTAIDPVVDEFNSTVADVLKSVPDASLLSQEDIDRLVDEVLAEEAE